jgi:radical SAM protein with 4Fe4S-binding SPASM domain
MRMLINLLTRSGASASITPEGGGMTARFLLWIRNGWGYFKSQRTRPLLTRRIALRLAYRWKPNRAALFPVYLDIEPNNYCNFRCPHCQVTHWSKPQVQLDRRSFEQIVGQFPRLAGVKLQGMGEPLLNREMLPMLQAGEARGVPMSFTSNGSVMTPAIIEALLGLRNTQISFSIDGATAAVFERVRVGGTFSKVSENIRRLVALRGHERQPAVEVYTVVTRENVAELPDIVRLAKNLGVDAITFQLFVSNWGKAEMEQRAGATRISRTHPDLDAALREAHAVAGELTMPIRIKHDNFLSREQPCDWPWRSAYIASNGDVVPCCIVADSSVIRMGNVFEQDFGEIWNNPAYQQLRTQIRTHQIPDFCRGCYGEQPAAAALVSPGPSSLQ